MKHLMRLRFLALVLGLVCCGASAQELEERDYYQKIADSLIKKAQSSEVAWNRLSTLCTLFPHRLSGSKGLEDGIDWIVSEMQKDGFTRVATEEVLVPHWERGLERLTVLKDKPEELAVVALGGSVSTSGPGIEAEALVVESYEELQEKKEQARGKIVVFDVPFTTYGETVGYRITAASRAADAGGVAALLRSVTPNSLATPHTGVMYYDEGSPKIPFGAITPEAAQHFHRLQELGKPARVRLVLESQNYPEATSRNIVAEIKGREFPEQVVLLGGHIDGWDIGEGAQDDGGGCVMSWEALRLIASSGLQPRRTIRVVLWTNEENGLAGGKAYRALHDLEVKDHVLAIESDYGTFHPSGYGFSGTKQAQALLQSILTLLESHIGEMSIKTPGGGADIRPLMNEGVPGAGLTHKDNRYFWYHHSAADTLDKVRPIDLKNGAATLAVTVFVVADMKTRLPFGKPTE